jgi:sugar phosphate isomerase/epimerase
VRDEAEVRGNHGSEHYIAQLSTSPPSADRLWTADVEDAQFTAVCTAFDGAGLGIPSVSGTFNLLHPDADLRARQIEQAVRLIGLVPKLGAGVLTLCTGTRDPENMWRAHSGNTDPSAWSDLRRSLDPLLEAAREAGIRLGVEPELANVVRDARTARRLLDEVGLDAPIGVILDPANLLTPTPWTCRTPSLVRPLTCLAAE